MEESSEEEPTAEIEETDSVSTRKVCVCGVWTGATFDDCVRLSLPDELEGCGILVSIARVEDIFLFSHGRLDASRTSVETEIEVS